MISTWDRPRALTHLCLAAMDIAWFTPLLLIVYATNRSLVAAFAMLLGALITEMLLLSLTHRLTHKLWLTRLVVVALVALTYLAALRVTLYATVPFRSWQWLQAVPRDLNPTNPNSLQATILLILNFYLWQRAAWSSSRGLDLFDVSTTLRAELVLFAASGVLYRTITGRRDTGALVWIFLACGLVALSLTRQRETAPGTRQAPPRPTARGRWAWIAMLAGGAVLGAWATWLMPGPLRTLLTWLVPLWEAIIVLLQVVLVFVTMVAVDLARALQSLMQGAPVFKAEGLRELANMVQALIQRLTGIPAAAIPHWALVAVEGLIIVLTLALFTGLVLFFVRLMNPQSRTTDTLAVETSSFPSPAEKLVQAASRLRTWARMVQRFGLSRQLLAAVSIQNIYANLCRLARRRGFARPPALPPDAYIATLIEAFGGHELALGRITEAYMRVHYGDRSLELSQLKALRADYQQVVRDT